MKIILCTLFLMFPVLAFAQATNRIPSSEITGLANSTTVSVAGLTLSGTGTNLILSGTVTQFSTISASNSGTATLNIAGLATLTVASVDIPVSGASSTGTPDISIGVSGTFPVGLLRMGEPFVVATGTVRVQYFNATALSVSATTVIRARVNQP